MAIFGFGKKGSADAGADAPKDAKAPVAFSPENAAKFFGHARTSHEAGNYEYAMSMWLRGLKFHPVDMNALQAFFQSAAAFGDDPKSKKGIDKDLTREFSGSSELDKYLRALLEWSLKPLDPACAVAACEAAGKLGLPEPTKWIGDRAMGAAMRDKKPRKDHFLKLKDALARVGAFDKAAVAADAALKIDPSDGELAAEMRNLAAQTAMTKGGFDQTGQAGGFRANIRDADKQRKLEDADKIVKTEDTVDRLITDAKADYESRPEDPAALQVYVKRLLERGKPEDEARALKLLDEAHKKFGQFRFRQAAGDLRIRQARRRVAEAKSILEANPLDEDSKSVYATAVDSLAALEIEEYTMRVAAYPTDLGFKFELGRRLFARGQYDDSIALFQEAQNDPKHRVQVLNMLGQSFHKIDYIDEAVETFRRALEARDTPAELQMELRYNLLCALQSKAESSRELVVAEEADKIASSIAVVQFNYRDIRQRRDTLKKLITELKARG